MAIRWKKQKRASQVAPRRTHKNRRRKELGRCIGHKQPNVIDDINLFYALSKAHRERWKMTVSPIGFSSLLPKMLLKLNLRSCIIAHLTPCEPNNPFDVCRIIIPFELLRKLNRLKNQQHNCGELKDQHVFFSPHSNILPIPNHYPLCVGCSA